MRTGEDVDLDVIGNWMLISEDMYQGPSWWSMMRTGGWAAVGRKYDRICGCSVAGVAAG
jgi:hypothetical protein